MLNSQHQAEDKLIILYVLNKIKTGLTREQIALIIGENLQMSYFDIQLYIDKLLEDEFIRSYTLEDHKTVIAITSSGRETLSIFKKQIPSYIIEMLDVYLEKNQDRIFKEITITATYKKNGEHDYQVFLKLQENNITLMELNINTPSSKEAINICDNWKEHTQNLYASIIRLLTSN